MARILPSPGQKIISLLLILLGGIILYLDINTSNFQSIKNGYNSFKISTNFFIKNLSINPIIDFSKHFQFKEKLIKENNELKLALEKSYVEKYLISQEYMKSRVSVYAKTHNMFFDENKVYMRSLDIMVTKKCSLIFCFWGPF